MLQVKDLSVHFSSYTFGLRKQEVCAIRSLDVNLVRGEVMALVGRSGAGKSLLAHALLGILPANARTGGQIHFKNELLTPRRMARLRGREIALIPQSVAFLNPLARVGGQVTRAARLSGLEPTDARRAAIQSLERYGLEKRVTRAFPFELSGGMARRVLTATATVGKAELILADEPLNGLDAAAARETLVHLRELADRGKAVLVITHDIAAALSIADRVTVFCDGLTVEVAGAGGFNGGGRLRHPYTRLLWATLPSNGFISALPAVSTISANGGCPSCRYCDRREMRCRTQLPMLQRTGDGSVRCHHA